MLEGRGNARPLEVSGLGYVNLLHIAVTLAAIPDAPMGGSPMGADLGDVESDGSSPAPQNGGQPASEEEVDDLLRQARAERESEEDSFFPSAPFHVTVVIEEPEAIHSSSTRWSAICAGRHDRDQSFRLCCRVMPLM